MFSVEGHPWRDPNRGKAMQRRDFFKVIGGAAASWSLPAGAQQRLRRIGILLGGFAADDPEGQARMTALIQGLQERGWTDGRNVRIDYRWAVGDPERLRKYAAELVALAPDIMVAGGLSAATALQQASRTIS
jgi:putative ABC transport system substrate-binding protein